MLLFILTRTFVPSLKNNFNTSHVTVYRAKTFRNHTMFFYFNTSHVTVYPIHSSLSINLIAYFNTSHVTVYLFVFPHINNYILFQYISCYCLSSLLFSVLLLQSYFNTSHVTVYPISFICRFKASSFQYISCYCLSKKK